MAALTNGDVVLGGSFVDVVHIGENDPDAVEFSEPGVDWATDVFLARYTSAGAFGSASHVTGDWRERVWDMEPAGQTILLDVIYLDTNNNPPEDTIVFMPGEANEAIVTGDWYDRVVARIALE